MATRIERLRDTILVGHPKSRLKRLSDARLAKIVAQYPTLPAHLHELFSVVGVGTVGSSRYHIHALLSPADVYDTETAASLTGVVLVGDDYAGVCEAYRVTGKRWRFGSVNESGTFVPGEPRRTFIDFLAEWYGSSAAG